MLTRASLAFLAGDVDEATRRSAEALEHGRRAGLNGVFGAFASQQFAYAWARGQLGSFVGQLSMVHTDRPDIPWRGGLALALAADGRVDDAEAVLDEVLDALEGPLTWMSISGVVVATEAAWVVGHDLFLKRAVRTLEHLRGYNIVLGMGAVDYGPVERYLALAESTIGSPAAALKQLRAIADDESTAPVWAARCRSDIAALDNGGTIGRGWADAIDAATVDSSR